MKKTLKRIGAAFLAGALAAALAVPAFAATATLNTEDEGVGTSGTPITEVAITKEVVLFNTATEDIYEPNITYTYGISVQNPDTAEITDKNNMTCKVKTGVEGLVKVQVSYKD